MDKRKKLLVLGGTSASLDVVQTAIDMGIYVIVTDDQEGGSAKEYADKVETISTNNFADLTDLIQREEIDGVFCGPSEFNIKNAMKLCEMANLPFYATKEQWDICSVKDSFKKLCRENNVPCVPEYNIHAKSGFNFNNIEYPVIVKPVDGCSSKGINVCYSNDETISAFNEALKYSESKKVITEKFIENSGIVTSVRYIANDGELYLSLTGDTYIVDPINRTALISAVTVFPSKYTSMYIQEINENVINMFKTIDVKNGVLFMQSLVDNDKLYFHEMGLRLSGGLTYKITDKANGVNDLRMMIRYALGGKIATSDEVSKINPYINNKQAVSLCIPLKVGKIRQIDGLERIARNIDLESFTQYYKEGDVITHDKIGTLLQHFGRFKFFADSNEDMIDKINYIQDNIKIIDTENNDMIYMRFDTERLL